MVDHIRIRVLKFSRAPDTYSSTSSFWQAENIKSSENISDIFRFMAVWLIVVSKYMFIVRDCRSVVLREHAAGRTSCKYFIIQSFVEIE